MPVDNKQIDRQLKLNDMKNYIVKSFHEVFVDDYNKGEGERVNGYALSGEVQANSPEEAITAYLRDNLGYDLTWQDCEVSDCKTYVQTACITDNLNIQPNEREYNDWMQGKIILYSQQIQLFVYEVIEVSF